MKPNNEQTQARTSGQTARQLRRGVVLATIVLTLAVLLAGIARWRQQHALSLEADKEARQVAVVSTLRVQAGGGAGDVALPGETAAWFESTIYARVSGYVARWTADLGDKVHQGQTLATIDTPELDAQLRAAEEQLKVAQSQVGIREAELALADTTYQRWRDSPKGVVSDQERDEKKANYDSAQARLNAARAQTALNLAEVDHFRALTAFKRVVAPFDGVITERHVDVGNLVSASAATASATVPLYRMMQDDPIRVFVDVPQNLATQVMAQKTPVVVRTQGNPVHRYDGHVVRSASALDPRARTLKVEIDLPNRRHELVPGAYVDVGFQINDSALVKVPASAIIFRAQGPQVALVDAASHIRFRDVVIARDEGSLLALASGVNAGERVAVNLSRGIAEGDLVEARDVTDAMTPRAPIPVGVQK